MRQNTNAAREVVARYLTASVGIQHSASCSNCPPRLRAQGSPGLPGLSEAALLSVEGCATPASTFFRDDRNRSKGPSACTDSGIKGSDCAAISQNCGIAAGELKDAVKDVVDAGACICGRALLLACSKASINIRAVFLLSQSMRIVFYYCVLLLNRGGRCVFSTPSSLTPPTHRHPSWRH